MLDRSYEAVLKRHVKSDGECLVWTGAVSKWGPHMDYLHDGKRAQAYPQRVALINKYNLDPKKRYIYSTSCGNPLCMNEAHLVLNGNGVPRVRAKYKKSIVHGMDLNMCIFSEVKMGVCAIARDYDITINAVYRIQKNTAMFPYFQHCIEKATCGYFYCGYTP